MNDLVMKKAQELAVKLFGSKIDFNKTETERVYNNECFFINRLGDKLISSGLFDKEYSLLSYSIYNENKDMMTLQMWLDDNSISISYGGGNFACKDLKESIDCFPKDLVADLAEKARIANELGYNCSFLDKLLKYTQGTLKPSVFPKTETTPYDGDDR